MRARYIDYQPPTQKDSDIENLDIKIDDYRWYDRAKKLRDRRWRQMMQKEKFVKRTFSTQWRKLGKQT